MKILDDKLVSIIMPIFNAEKYVQESIESIVNQSYSRWELIIVDDCSSDNSSRIIKKFTKDARIKYIKLKKNLGAAVARNRGLEVARGRYIAFLDSDDLWHKEKLQYQLEFMRKMKCGFSFTEYKLINEEGKDLNKKMKVTNVVDYEYLLKNTIIGCSTVMIDKKIIGDFKMPLIRTRQDNATWLKLLRNGNKAYGLRECLTSYRIVRGSLSRNKFKAISKQWYVYRKIEKIGFFVAMKYFIIYCYNATIKRL